MKFFFLQPGFLLLTLVSGMSAVADDIGTVIVTRDLAEVKVEGNVVGYLGIGTPVWATKFSEDQKWAWVKIPGKQQFGWLKSNDAKNFEASLRDQDTWQQVLVQNQVALDKQNAGQHEESRTAAQKALDLAESVLPRFHPELSTTHSVLASAHENLEDYENARRHYEAVLLNLRHFKGTDHFDTHNCCVIVANTLSKEGRIGLACDYYRVGIAGFRSQSQVPSRKVQRRYVECLRLAERHMLAVAEAERLIAMFGRDSEGTVEYRQALFLHSQSLLLAGENAKAETTIRRLLAMQTADDNVSDELLAQTTNSLAISLIRQEKHAEAESVLRKALEFEELPQQVLAAINCNVSLTLAMQDRFDAAEALLVNLSETRDAQEQTPFRSFVLKNRGILALRKGESIAAEAHFQECLSIRNRLQPESHLVSEALAFLADVALAAGNTAAEADLLQRSLAVSLTSNGYDHPTSQKLLARTLTAVATVNGESAAKQVETDFGQSRPGPDRPTYDSLIGPETYREPIQPIGIGEVIVIRNSPARIESGGNFTAEAGNSFWALAEKNGEYRVALAGGNAWISKSAVTLVNPQTVDEGQSQVQRLEQLLAAYREGSRFQVAYTIARHRLDIVDRTPESPLASYANLAPDVAILLAEFGEIDRAAGLLEAVLPRVQQGLGNDNEWTQKLILKLGTCYHKGGNYNRAWPLLKQAGDYFVSAHGELHLQAIEARASVGSILQVLGQLAEAETQLETAANSCIQVNGTAHYLSLEIRKSLALVRQERGRFQAARRDLLTILRDAQSTATPDQKFIAATLSDLSFVELRLGNAVAARDYGLRALRVYSSRAETNNAGYAVALTNVGQAYSMLGAMPEAEQYLRNSIELSSRLLGANSSRVATACSILADVLSVDHPERRALIERAWDIEMRSNKINPITGTILANRGVLAIQDGEFEFARRILERSVEVESQQYGHDHERTATAKMALGILAVETDNLDLATARFREVLDTYRQSLGELNPSTFSLHRAIGTTLLPRDPQNAIDAFDEYQKVVRRFSSSRLPALTDAERTRFHLNRQYHLQELLSLAPEVIAVDSLVNHQFEWLVNGKNINGDAGVAQANFLRSLKDNGALARLHELQTQREPSIASGATDVVSALDREEALLLKQTLHGADFPEARWTTLNVVGQQIPKSAIYIDIARIIDHAPVIRVVPETEPFSEIYVAWVADSDGHVSRHVLGDAFQIDAKVRALRTAVADVNSIQEKGEIEATKAFVKAARPLSQTLFGPLLSRISGKNELIISPDSTLWLLPWQALLSDNDSYFAESFAIRTVTSGRELRPREQDTSSGAIVFADPEFGTPTTGNSVRNWLNLPAVTPLPGTATEAAAILPSLKQLAKENVQAHLGEDASEERLAAVLNPQTLVVSSHGFFLPDYEFRRTTTSFHQNLNLLNNRNLEARIPSPLSRCGLLLSNANKRGADPGNDGIVTGQEISRLQLNGTDLVVLSACETGLGDVRSGESVAGLRQAFQFAGAKSVIASLWQVDDRSTARLMNDFFGKLADGSSRTDALREAQVSRIEARRQRNGAAHPFFWAAFTLTGQN